MDGGADARGNFWWLPVSTGGDVFVPLWLFRRGMGCLCSIRQAQAAKGAPLEPVNAARALLTRRVSRLGSQCTECGQNDMSR